MNNRVRQTEVVEYLTNNQQIYLRIVDNLHSEHRYYNRRTNNTSMYRNIINSLTRSENALVDRYIYQSPIPRSPLYDLNNFFTPPLVSRTVNTTPENTPPVTTTPVTTTTESILDISGNVTFTEWPNYESVPVDASGNTVPIERCPITHHEFVEGDSIGRINNCGHVFSERGLRRWLIRNNTCPMCRERVDPSYNSLQVYGTNLMQPNSLTNNII
jgi:hypothetical protein